MWQQSDTAISHGLNRQISFTFPFRLTPHPSSHPPPPCPPSKHRGGPLLTTHPPTHSTDKLTAQLIAERVVCFNRQVLEDKNSAHIQDSSKITNRALTLLPNKSGRNAHWTKSKLVLRRLPEGALSIWDVTKMATQTLGTRICVATLCLFVSGVLSRGKYCAVDVVYGEFSIYSCS